MFQDGMDTQTGCQRRDWEKECIRAVQYINVAKRYTNSDMKKESGAVHEKKNGKGVRGVWKVKVCKDRKIFCFVFFLATPLQGSCLAVQGIKYKM